GGESGNLDSLMAMGKKYKEDSTIAAVKACIKAKLGRIIVSFIIGLPSEDLLAIKKTLTYAYKIRDLDPEHVIISIYKATPYPSTAFWIEMEKEGRLSHELEKYDLALPKGLVFDHPIFGFEAKEIDELLHLWKVLTGLKYLIRKYQHKELSFTQISTFVSRLIQQINSLEITFPPRWSTPIKLHEPQILIFITNLIRELEKLMLI
ncbi:MAG: hypothetical protein ACTSQQ_06170, partial [Candidatus Helarchaeota archaeon]